MHRTEHSDQAHHPIIDFRSDTVTKPCPGMLQAMMEAPVGDDVYGEDPSVQKLERSVAALLGKEAGIFVPSGTMANQLALNIHTRPGQAVICEPDSHIFLFEGGAAAANSGLQANYLRELTSTGITDAFRGDGIHEPETSLLSLENTHNMGGGRIIDPQTIKALISHSKSLGIQKHHCDGARLWNAASRLGTDEKSLCEDFDTVSVCFSKGLGCPVGSLLVGSQKDIDAARKIRKRWGGAMRQAGYLAACALYAIEHNRSRLHLDHEQAAAFAEAFKHHSRLRVDYPEVGTNIVFFSIEGSLHLAKCLVTSLKDRGILTSLMSGGRIRLVWHKDLPSSANSHLIDHIQQFLTQNP